MKFRFLLVSIIAIFCVYSMYKLDSQEQLNTREGTILNSEKTSIKPRPIVRHKIAKGPKMASEAIPEEAEPVPEEAVIRLRELISTVKLDDKSSFLSTLRVLRRDPQQIRALHHEFKSLKIGEDLKRDKILFLAGKIDSPETIPLWKDMLHRETPRFHDEEKLLNIPHPNLESRLLAVEQMQAIRKLGQIAFQDKEAKKILFDTALGNTPVPTPVSIRKRALQILQESDANAYIKFMTQVDKDDELYNNLKKG